MRQFPLAAIATLKLFWSSAGPRACPPARNIGAGHGLNEVLHLGVLQLFPAAGPDCSTWCRLASI
jgi:hypothetical protein